MNECLDFVDSMVSKGYLSLVFELLLNETLLDLANLALHFENVLTLEGNCFLNNAFYQPLLPLPILLVPRGFHILREVLAE